MPSGQVDSFRTLQSMHDQHDEYMYHLIQDVSCFQFKYMHFDRYDFFDLVCYDIMLHTFIKYVMMPCFVFKALLYVRPW